MSTLNERIKLRRKELGLTQKELADMLSISDKTVSRWESSNQMPDAILIPEIAQCLQMTLNELYGIYEDKVAYTSDNTANTEKYPTEKLWLSLSYKLTMLLSVFVVLLGCIFNNYADEPLNTAGMVLIIIGLGILLFVELAYNITYRDSKIYNPLYLRNDIIFCGVATLSIIPLLHIIDFNDTYLLITLAIAYKVVITLQKRKLNEHDIVTKNRTSKWLTILFIAFTFLFLAAMIFFDYFYFHIYKEQNYTVALAFEIISTGNVLMGFGVPFGLANNCNIGILPFCFAVVIYVIFPIEYITLLKKSKQLTTN